MGQIDMVNDGVPLGKTPEDMIQSGGGGTIEMYGGGGVTLSHTPVSSVQTSGSSGSIDMVGVQGLLNKTPTPSYNSKQPSDKGV